MDYRRFLKEELHKRQQKNRAYSMRAFSRDIGIASSRLSEILHGKVGLSEKKAAALADRLELDEATKHLFVDMVESEHSRSAVVRAAASLRVKARFLQASELKDSEMNLLSEWHHLAILELLTIGSLEHTVFEFAKKLKVPEAEVESSIQQLISMGFMKRENNRWIPTEPDSTTSTEIPSATIRQYHTQMLEKARIALQEQPIQKRDFSSVVFAMNANQMEYAKQRIQEFRRSLVKELEGIPGKDSVYCLSVNMFSLTEEN